MIVDQLPDSSVYAALGFKCSTSDAHMLISILETLPIFRVVVWGCHYPRRFSLGTFSG